MHAGLVLAIVVVAGFTGCLGGSERVASVDEEPTSREPVGPTLALLGCAELNFIVAVPMAEAHFVHPFVPTPLDPAGATFALLVTGLACDEATYGDASGGALGYFGLVPVEPLDGAELPEAAGYLLGLYLGTRGGALEDAFEGRIEESGRDDVSLEFTAIAGRSHARGTMLVAPDAFIESVMADEAAAGPAGVLGLYTRTTEGVLLHAAHFSAYMAHAQGVAVVSPGPIVTPLPIEDPPGPTTATHNYGFDLTFEFDVLSLPS